MAHYAEPGYQIIDRKTSKIQLIPDWRSLDHNSGCTNIVTPPLFSIHSFPYLISRNRFKLDLIDLRNLRVEGLSALLNTPGM